MLVSKVLFLVLAKKDALDKMGVAVILCGFFR